MTEVTKEVSLPQAASDLADGLQQLVLAVIASHKEGGGVAAELSKDVLAAVSALTKPLGELGAFGEELKTDSIGVAEALALAGFGIARTLKGELPKA